MLLQVIGKIIKPNDLKLANKRLIHKDERGRIISIMEYNSTGNLIYHEDPQTRQKRYYYYNNGLKTKVLRGEDLEIEYIYNDKNQIERVEAVTYVQYNEYNERGLKIYDKVIFNRLNNDMLETWYKYDNNDRLIYQRNDLGNETRYEYNDDGELMKEITHASTKTYLYDTDGLLISVLSPTANNTLTEFYKYNTEGLLIASKNPLGTIHTYDYEDVV